MIKHSASYFSIKRENDTHYSFDVLFHHPICLEEERKYEIQALIDGPNSCYGAEGQTSVECEGIQFNFISSNSSPNGTDVTGGLFSALIFSKVKF